MDDILGTLNESGVVVKWPKCHIMGGRYTPPATRVMVSPNTFVVLPAGFTKWERVEEIKTVLNTGKSSVGSVNAEAETSSNPAKPKSKAGA